MPDAGDGDGDNDTSAAHLLTPTPPHSPATTPDFGQQLTGEYRDHDDGDTYDDNARGAADYNGGGDGGGGGGDGDGGYGNIEDAPFEPETDPYNDVGIDPSLIRGICGMCHKPVLVTQVRNKNSAGVYFHGNLDDCVVATDLQ